MIFIERGPTPPADVKEIRNWLFQRGCVAFQRHLSNVASGLAAEVGNAMAENNEVEAEKLNGKLQEILSAIKVLEMVLSPEYEFPAVSLKPKPLATET